MTLSETIVAMAISAMLLGGVLSTMYLSVKLVNTAPPDTNPHTFGALAAQVARLEGAATGQQECLNPPTATTRTDCLKVVPRDEEPQDHDIDSDSTPEHQNCWVVNTDNARRLECWELLLPQGNLVAHIYAPDTDNLGDCITGTDTTDCLHIEHWASEADAILPRASGLKLFEWECLTTDEATAYPTPVVPPDSCARSFAVDPDGPGHLARVQAASCAAIDPGQRRLMTDDEVPFCKGEPGVPLDGRADADGNLCLSLPAPMPSECIEGYPMPTLRVFS